MTSDSLLAGLWRSKKLFLAVLASCVAAVVLVTLSLPTTYSATATMYVGSKGVSQAAALNTAVGEQLTRTYTTLASNPNVADEVRLRLPMDLSRSELLDRMSFAPVERTQLLQVSAEGGSGREAAQVANTYATTFAERVGRQFDAGRTQTKVSVNEPAAVPADPSKPNPPLYIGLGVVLSLILATGVTLLRERLDTRVRVPVDQDELYGEAIVGRVPRMGERRAPGAATEAFRMVRANIDFVDDGASQVVMVTSANPFEGKSTLATNLAMACIAHGESVVLVDCDLRHPGLGRHTPGPEPGTVKGLTNFLAGDASEPDISRHPDLPGVSVIWAGPQPPNPPSLLDSPRVSVLLARLRDRYDRVIVDTAPVLVGAETSLLAPKMDGIVYVIDASRTTESTALAGLNQLRKVSAHLLGVVVNNATMAGRGGYYYEYAGPVDEPTSTPAAAEERDELAPRV